MVKEHIKKSPDPLSNTSLKIAARIRGDKNAKGKPVTRADIRERMGREKINNKKGK